MLNLSNLELAVLKAKVEGKRNGEIAKELNRHLVTINNCPNRLVKKLSG